MSVGWGQVIEATLSFGAVDLASQTIAIHLGNSAPVSGFQFEVTGLDLSSGEITGGSAQANGFDVIIGDNDIVLGYSNTTIASEIPAGNDILTYIKYDGFTNGLTCNSICLSGGVITSGYENPQFFNVSLGPCIFLYSKGDINTDNALNVLDIVQIVNIIFETTIPDVCQTWAADFNGDGAMNIMDIVQIVNAIFPEDCLEENDCLGQCGGSAVIDACGVCNGGNADDFGCGCFVAGPSGCDNACGSTAVADVCNVCGGPGLGSPNGFCYGILNINSDACSLLTTEGDCGGNVFCIWAINPCDCNGNVDADSDGVCDNVDDCIGLHDCNGDCHCEIDGTSDANGGTCEQFDACGVCDGNGVDVDSDGICDDIDDCLEGTGTYDCNGECNGSLVNDECGVCGGDGSSCICDYDGNCYTVVQIGDQLWMAENLKVTHYNDGSEIPNITTNGDWGSLLTGAFGVYNNDPLPFHGNLYNWYTVDDDRGVCPAGWHVPTDEEFKELEMFLGMSDSEANDTGYRGTDEGSKLAGNSELWNDGNLENNSVFGTSGFKAHPGGYRSFSDGTYHHVGVGGYFWLSSESSNTDAWYRILYFNNSTVTRYDHGKQYGSSIRCLED